MSGTDIALIVVALAAAGGSLFVLRWFFKRLHGIQEARWGVGRYESRLHQLILRGRRGK